MQDADLQTLPSGSRVLMVLTDLVGDTLFRTPAVHLLSRHYPHLSFDVLVFSSGAASIFRHSEAVGRVHVLTRRGAVRELAERYDLLINLRRTNSRKYLAGLSTPCLTYRKGSRSIHKAADLLNYAAMLLPESATVTDDDRRYRLPVSPAERERVEELLSEHGIDPARDTLVGFHPGCAGLADYHLFFAVQRFFQHRRAWPITRHVELARRLNAARPGVRCIAIGSARESFLGHRLTRSVPGAVNLAGRLNLPELAALMDKLHCFVCHDTGPLHVACARQTPLVALIGPTRPERTGPYPDLPRFTVLRAKRMQDLPVEQAEQAVLHRLDSPADHAQAGPASALADSAPR